MAITVSCSPNPAPFGSVVVNNPAQQTIGVTTKDNSAVGSTTVSLVAALTGSQHFTIQASANWTVAADARSATSTSFTISPLHKTQQMPINVQFLDNVVPAQENATLTVSAKLSDGTVVATTTDALTATSVSGALAS